MTDLPNRMTGNVLSLETAAAITERSKRTWQRRVTDGLATKLPNDGARAMLLVSDVAPLVEMPMSTEDLEYLFLADQGDAAAQADMGELFRASGKYTSAHYWFALSADQNNPDAMQCLAQMFAAGEGVPKNNELSIMWLAKAAAHGHIIAKEQLRKLPFGALA